MRPGTSTKGRKVFRRLARLDVVRAGLRGTVPPPQATLFHGVHRSLPGQAIVADLTSGLLT